MNSLIVFASIIACASAGSILYGAPAYATAYAPAYAPVAPLAYAGGYKEHTIIPQPPIIKKYAKTEVVGSAPIEHGVTIKHYSAHPAGFGYSHRSYGIHGARSSDSYVSQPEHAVVAKTVVHQPAVVAYSAPVVGYAAPLAGYPLVH